MPPFELKGHFRLYRHVCYARRASGSGERDGARGCWRCCAARCERWRGAKRASAALVYADAARRRKRYFLSASNMFDVYGKKHILSLVDHVSPHHTNDDATSRSGMPLHSNDCLFINVYEAVTELFHSVSSMFSRMPSLHQPRRRPH